MLAGICSDGQAMHGEVRRIEYSLARISRHNRSQSLDGMSPPTCVGIEDWSTPAPSIPHDRQNAEVTFIRGSQQQVGG